MSFAVPGCSIRSGKVVIDTDKGLDVLAKTPLGASQARPPHEQQEASITQHPPPDKLEKSSLIEETHRARKICENTRTAIGKMFTDARMGRAVKAGHAATLVEEISNSIQRHPHALINLARLKTADDYTYMHSVAVCALMVALARQLELDETLVRTAGIAGLLHDIGKMAIPNRLLNKPGRLTDAEFSAVRQHPQAGYRMLLESNQISHEVLDVALHHHEKYDGSGYPNGLAGQDIGLLARMGAVCDVYDAITSNRAYKAAWDPAESLHRMARWKGHFDKKILQAFVKAIGIYPIGSLVRLESGRIGVVLEQHPASLLTPKVKVFHCAHLKQPIPIEVIDLQALAGKDWIICREPAESHVNVEALSLDESPANAHAQTGCTGLRQL